MGTHRVGVVRALLAQHGQPRRRVRLVGRPRQGVEPEQLQAALQPGRPQGLRQQRHHLPRRLALRVRRPRRYGHAWDLTEGKHLYSLDAGSVIHTLVFSPNRYWLCAGTDKNIIIWDLESKSVVAQLDSQSPDFHVHQQQAITSSPACLSLAWNDAGSTLFAGYSDQLVRVWSVVSL